MSWKIILTGAGVEVGAESDILLFNLTDQVYQALAIKDTTESGVLVQTETKYLLDSG
jgi:hypothetical protein